MKILGTKVTAAKADTPTMVKSEGVYEQAVFVWTLYYSNTRHSYGKMVLCAYPQNLVVFPQVLFELQAAKDYLNI